MREKVFQDEITRSISWLSMQIGRHIHYFKIPDAPKFAGSRFNPQKGYDSFLVDLGIHHVLELKLSTQPRVAFDALNEGQENQMMSNEIAGGRSFVVVNFRITFSKPEMKRRGETMMIAAFAVPIQDWLFWRSSDCRASIPLSKMESEAIYLPRLRLPSGIGWDLQPILEAP